MMQHAVTPWMTSRRSFFSAHQRRLARRLGRIARRLSACPATCSMQTRALSFTRLSAATPVCAVVRGRCRALSCRRQEEQRVPGVANCPGYRAGAPRAEPVPVHLQDPGGAAEAEETGRDMQRFLCWFNDTVVRWESSRQRRRRTAVPIDFGSCFPCFGRALELALGFAPNGISYSRYLSA
ncbi:hypothetical protein MPH_04092 [Macrophomina phaseolina MS6]|uniref:Uncharacterized protein n=1 Tax=Macrophomina phaseolina (strain MS6) TaxID=1126212 RepID=K2S892_MACPH|nr:hypothetical protein MPH_04092 [Macrophomina phaseolina MS6]